MGSTYRDRTRPKHADGMPSVQIELEAVLARVSRARNERRHAGDTGAREAVIPDPDDVTTLADLSFRDLGGSTEVHLTQGPFKTEARRALHRDGWTDSFDKLEQLISRA